MRCEEVRFDRVGDIMWKGVISTSVLKLLKKLVVCYGSLWINDGFQLAMYVSRSIYSMHE